MTNVLKRRGYFFNKGYKIQPLHPPNKNQPLYSVGRNGIHAAKKCISFCSRPYVYTVACMHVLYYMLAAKRTHSMHACELKLNDTEI
jgi:hypothetical protein